MCLIVTAWSRHPRYRLVLAANRDELHARPSAPLHAWEEPDGIVGGRDLEAGGTWLGVHRRGRLAAVTNVRETPQAAPAELSRGALPIAFLHGSEAPLAFVSRAVAEGDRYGACNLLVADRTGLALGTNRGDAVVELEPGLHALGNARLGDAWPKMQRAREALAAALAGDDAPASLTRRLFAMMRDDAPDADGGHEPDSLAHRASAVFVVGPVYGTRATTVVLWDRDGAMHVAERRYGPGGRRCGETALAVEATHGA